jgi:hypothetical protein
MLNSNDNFIPTGMPVTASFYSFVFDLFAAKGGAV